MAQSVWQTHEIENILRSVELACQSTAAQYAGNDNDSFMRGVSAALAATATSFGIRIAEGRVRSRVAPAPPSPPPPALLRDSAA